MKPYFTFAGILFCDQMNLVINLFF